MKKIIVFAAIILSVLLLLPLTAIGNSQESTPTLSPLEKIPMGSDSFKILNTTTDQVTELSAKDYIFGVIAAEMPALYETEALKAQAVAAYTFAKFRQKENRNKSYDLTDDYLSDQCYISKETAFERWGGNAEEYSAKIENILTEVEGLVIKYENEPILAVYHAISFGTTESAENVWGRAYPYLVPVSSEGDKLCENYKTAFEITAENLKQKFGEEIVLSGEEQNYFSNIQKTDSGTVKTVNVCGNNVNGSKLRSLLDLRSSNFDIKYENNKFIFTVYGYGHSVGMSQNGANYMAKQGADFKEILNHYYKDCKIEKE